MTVSRPIWLNGMLGAICFSVMGLLIGHSDQQFTSADYLFGRGFFCVVALFPFILSKILSKQFTLDATVFLRGLFGTFALMISFWMIKQIGPAPARAIHATHPLFVFLLSLLFLNFKLTKYSFIGIASVILGILLPALSTSDNIETRTLFIGIFGSFLAGISLFILKKSATKLPETTVLWFFALVQIILQIAIGPAIPSIPLQTNYSLIFGSGFFSICIVGALACFGQLFMTSSFKELSAPLASTLNLVSIPLTFTLEYIIFGKAYGFTEMVMSLLILNGVIFLRLGG